LFHKELLGETTTGCDDFRGDPTGFDAGVSAARCSTRNCPVKQQLAGMTSGPIPAGFDAGFVLGVLVGEGHFGGDGRQPQITLKLHVRHEKLLRYILTVCAGGRLYGPYHHGERHYFQLMYRGTALRDVVVPFLDGLPWAQIDPHSFERYSAMKARYARFLASAVT
jgi:hypothetical protein